MGCDGGTIPRRDELVKVRKKPEQVLSATFSVSYKKQILDIILLLK